MVQHVATLYSNKPKNMCLAASLPIIVMHTIKHESHSVQQNVDLHGVLITFRATSFELLQRAAS